MRNAFGGELSFKEICRRLESRYEGDFSSPAAAWIKLDQAFQQQTESLFQWSDRLNKIGDSIFRLDVGGRKSLEPQLISKFCFAAWDRDAGVKAMEQGPPKSLEEAVESVRGYQHVQGAADNNCAERPRAKVRGWSPEREKLDCRDQYPSRRDAVDSRSDRYRGSSRAVQSQSAYRARSPEFRGMRVLYPVRKMPTTVNGTVGTNIRYGRLRGGIRSRCGGAHEASRGLDAGTHEASRGLDAGTHEASRGLNAGTQGREKPPGFHGQSSS